MPLTVQLFKSFPCSRACLGNRQMFVGNFVCARNMIVGQQALARMDEVLRV